ncbi:hypothetical protein JW766_01365 [Candidatus Dojkabacteria bacterium]|nr:hypothetical protein [Candidatus Dojkabacteria bacterium]
MKKLILFDHDGTICKSNLNAYDSMTYAAEQAAKNLGIDIKKIEVEWSKVFNETRGTTEKNLVHYLVYLFHIPLDKFSEFERMFYLAREAWYKNMKKYKEFVYDLYYPDAEILIDKLKEKKDNILRLVTGNPSNVLKQRIANFLRSSFIDSEGELLGYFGESAYSRVDLISLAISSTQKEIEDFKPEYSDDGSIRNVYYIADSRADLFAALYAKIRIVWIASRTLQEVKDIESEDAMSYILKMHKNRILLTNNLEDEDVMEFLTGADK